MKSFSTIALAAAFLGFTGISIGCKTTAKPDAPVATDAGGPPAGKPYPVKGKVVSTDAAHGEVTIDAAAIPGFMEAMTMPYKLRNPGIISELHPGDQLTATVYVTDTDSLLDRVVITGQAKPDYAPPVWYHELKAGDDVPNFGFINQSGKLIRLEDFKGKTVLLTFIYTRCPLPDFCPRMSRNFAKIDKALAGDPRLYAKTHLLSISFDPDYDTPAVLKSYGGAYTERYTEEKFEHWDFVVPPKRELKDVEKFFDVGATPQEDKTIMHSVSTVVIGPDGKVEKFYPTNDWTVEEALAEMKRVAAKS